MRISKFTALFLTMLLGLFIIGGCVFRPSGPPPDSLEIFFSGDTKGELYKCG